MRKHPEIGARILGTRELVDIREWVLASHERPDGRGYPRGLSGEAIPLEGRIAAVADCFDALMSKRPYKPALPLADVLAIMRAGRGEQFDPTILDLFVGSIDEALAIVQDSAAVGEELSRMTS
jgi:putative two-component system response regulator